MVSQEKMLMIINPVAGKLKARDVDFPALFPEYDVTVYYTKDGETTEKYVEDNAGTFPLVVCAGGDGTLNRVINGLMRLPERPHLGYIPAGTTNDFALSLGISKEIPKAAEAIRFGKGVPLDVGAFNARHFMYVASFGAFSDSSYKASQDVKNRIGHLAYVLEALKDISNIRPFAVKVKTEKEIFEGEYVFGAVSNTTSLGGIMRLSPKDISYDDGLFEVMLISMPRTAQDLQQIIFSLARKQYDTNLITFFKASRLEITTEQACPWSLDGEFAEGAKNIHIINHPKAIMMQI